MLLVRRAARPLLRLTVGITAAMALQAVVLNMLPGPAVSSDGPPSSMQAVSLGTNPRFVLPAPPPPRPSYLAQEERPDTVGEPAPREAQPDILRPGPPPRRISSESPPEISAAAWLVMDEGSGQVLFSRNGHRRRSPASITKIMTALLAVERGKLDQEVVSEVMGSDIPDSTLVGLWPGDILTLRDLVYGLMLHSGNDAAVQIGITVSGSERAFVNLMNRRAAELGLRDTQFANPHGLDQDGHFSSAFDMAALSRYAMSYPEFATVVKALDWRVNGPPSYGMFNGNRLLREYEGADGVKIGNTDLGGQTIVGSVTRNGHRVYVVVLGSRDRTADSKALLDYTFAHYRWE